MIIPNGATHRWSCSDQYAKRCGDKTWAIWQDHQWLWIGDAFKGQMVPLVSDREGTIAEMKETICTAVKYPNGQLALEYAEALYDAGYRKFEIVEEDV